MKRKCQPMPGVPAARCRTFCLGLSGFVLTFVLVAAGPSLAANDDPTKDSIKSTGVESQNFGDRTEEAAPDKPMAPKPDADLLEDVQDGTPFPAVDVRDLPPEAKAYYDVLILAHTTSPQALANSARRGVTYANLFQEPWKYRGDVIHYEGEMTLLRSLGLPKYLEGGGFDIQNMYEGWIFNTDVNFNNPVCVVLTELPPGLVATEKRMSAVVSFDGYFFKKLRYKDAAGQTRDAPLLIGRTVQLVKLPLQPSAAPVAELFGVAFLGVLGLLVVLTIGLSWWYRRGDRRIHAALAASKTVVFEDMEPGPTPEVGPVPPRNRLEEYRSREPS